MNYAILDDANVVQNIILASEAFCRAVYPNRWVALQPGQWCDLGATYNPATGAFTAAG